MCKCTNTTEVEIKSPCISCHKYLHFTVKVNKTSNCHKNAGCPADQSKQEVGVQH